MNKIVKIRVFNSVLSDFLSFLKEFPSIKSDVILSETKINTVNEINPRIVIEKFIEYTSDYKKQILDCNANFILNNVKDVSEYNDLFNRIKNIWVSSSTTDLQKAKIWAYMHKLIKIAEEIQ